MNSLQREEALERYQQGMIGRAVSMRGRKPGEASFEARSTRLSTIEHVVFRHEGQIVDCFTIQMDGGLKRLKRFPKGLAKQGGAT